MILDATTRSVEVKLGEVMVTTQPSLLADWADITAAPSFTPGCSNAAANSTTVVTLVAAPASSTQRSVRYINIYNGDTIAHVVVVQYNDNATIRILYNGSLAIGASLIWTPEGGWLIAATSNGGLTQAQVLSRIAVGI